MANPEASSTVSHLEGNSEGLIWPGPIPENHDLPNSSLCPVQNKFKVLEFFDTFSPS